MAALLLSLALAACGGGRTRGPANERAADAALAQVGAPYRFGGTSPDTGFDCSGLVHFSYGKAGRQVPRATGLLYKASKKVSVASLRRGDLLFFDQEGKKSSHVGIYVGGGEFVHAPSSGKKVRRERLDAKYWKKHLSSARRL